MSLELLDDTFDDSIAKIQSQKPEMLTNDCPPAHVNDIYPNVSTGADKSRLILPKTSEVRGAA